MNDNPGGRKWGEAAPQETDKTVGLDNSGVLKLQEKTMKEQDDRLNLLGESIGRQKQIAYAIEGEVDEQIALLDELDEGVDSTSKRIRNTTKRLNHVTKKANTRGMWCIICLLFLALVGVSVAALY